MSKSTTTTKESPAMEIDVFAIDHTGAAYDGISVATRSAQEACDELFAAFPEAAQAAFELGGSEFRILNPQLGRSGEWHCGFNEATEQAATRTRAECEAVAQTLAVGVMGACDYRQGSYAGWARAAVTKQS